MLKLGGLWNGNPVIRFTLRVNEIAGSAAYQASTTDAVTPDKTPIFSTLFNMSTPQVRP